MSTFAFGARSYAFTPYVDAQNFIGGEWVNPSGADRLPILNPRHGQAISHVTMSTAADVDAAVRAGAAAQKDWGEWPLRERAQVLYRAREIIVRDAEELTWLVSHGKLWLSSAVSVSLAMTSRARGPATTKQPRLVVMLRSCTEPSAVSILCR